MKTIKVIVVSLGLSVVVVHGQGTTLWNEAVNGPLSEIGNNPTQLGLLFFGTNTIIGATQIEPTGNNWLVHEDIFTFYLPASSSVTAVYVSIDKPNVGVWIGDTGFSTPLGYTGSAVNGDLLFQWGVSPLTSGSQGMVLGNYDPQTFISVANYRLDFFVESIPEPNAISLLLIGAGLFALRSKSKSQLKAA